MTDQDGLKEVFSGHHIVANYVKELLEQSNIGSLLKDTNQENFLTGDSEGTIMDFTRVYVSEQDFKKASKIIEEYRKSQK